MRHFLITLSLTLSLLVFPQNNCRVMQALDTANQDRANISCAYPFNANGCIELHAEYTDVLSTSTYNVIPTTYQPAASFDSGTLLSISADDKFSDAINIPFDFYYFDQVYNKVVIGDNGIISFDTSMANGDSPYFSSQLPNPALYNNTIYGLYHDITNDSNVFGCSDDPATGKNECGEIRYQTIGSAPCRKFVVSYSNINHFNCEENKSSFQIILHETTNEIEVQILHKPINCEEEGSGNYRKYASIGIQNQNGLKAFTPAGRNNEVFTTDKEAWKFVPGGASVMSFNWYNAEDALIGSGKTLEICEIKNQNIRLEATYNHIGKEFVVNDEFPIVLDPSYPVVKESTVQVCDEGNDNAELVDLAFYAKSMVNNPYSITFFNSKSDAIANQNPLDNNLNLTGKKTVFVKLSADASCFAINTLTLELQSKPKLLKNELIICDNNNDKKETVKLSDYINELVGNNSNVETTFYATESNAQNGTNAITDLQLTANKTIYIKLNSGGTCNTISALQLSLVVAPVAPEAINAGICDNLSGIALGDYLPNELKDPSFSVSYYKSQSDAENKKDAIMNPHQFRLNGVTKLYVRVQNGGNCYSIVPMNFTYLNSLKPKSDTRVQCDSDKTGDETFDLSLSIPDMLSNPQAANIEYYTTKTGALYGIAADKISNFNAYKIPISKTIVYVRFQEKNTGCISVEEIILFALPIPKPARKQFDFCDVGQDGKEAIALHSLDASIISGQVFIENTYYNSEDDAIIGSNPINGVMVQPTAKVYLKMAIKFEGKELCFEVYEIQLQLLDRPATVEDYNIEMCDVNGDKIETVNLWAYKNYITGRTGINNLVFLDSNGAINNPANYKVENGTVVFAREKNESTCHKGMNLIFTLKEGITVNDFNVSVCDAPEYNSENINLVDELLNNQPSIANHPYTFYKTKNGALDMNQNLKIANPSAYLAVNAKSSVFVRVGAADACYSIIQININLLKTPQVNNTSIEICDDANDGKETIADLSTLYDDIFAVQNYKVAYFATEANAENNSNPINSLEVVGDTKVYVRVSVTDGITCATIGAIDITLNKVPKLKSVETHVCDNQNDNQELYNLEIHQEDIIDNAQDFTFEYYTSKEDAVKGSNKIANASNYLLKDTNYIVFAKVINAKGCFAITTLTINFDKAPVVSNLKIGSCDYDFNMVETFDLTSYIGEVVENPTLHTIEYYSNYNAAEAGNTEFLLPNPKAYVTADMVSSVYVRILKPSSACFSIARIDVEVYKLPKLVDANILVCDNNLDGKHEVDLSILKYEIIENVDDFTFEYYKSNSDANSRTNKLTETPYNLNNIDDKLYAVVTNKNGCSAICTLSFTANQVTFVPTNKFEISKCDDDYDGKIDFDLNEYASIFIDNNVSISYFVSEEDAKLNQNEISNPSNYINTSKVQQIFTRVTESGKCVTIGYFFIKIFDLPTNPFPEYYEKCPEESMILDAENEGCTYQWSDGSTGKTCTVSEPGIYTVTLTNSNGCETTFTVEVRNYKAPVVNYTFTDQHTVNFDVVGDSRYSYSLDKVNWTNNNIFYNLAQGVYTLYVKDLETGCLSSIQFLVFDWFTIFTPNGDGLNDVWSECGLEAFGDAKSKITIFDRYGKTIFTQESNSCFTWDGKYMGRALPTDTYWFAIALPDGRQFNGYIAIKNY